MRVQPLAKRDAVNPGLELTGFVQLGERDLDLTRQSAADVPTGRIGGLRAEQDEEQRAVVAGTPE